LYPGKDSKNSVAKTTHTPLARRVTNLHPIHDVLHCLHCGKTPAIIPGTTVVHLAGSASGPSGCSRNCETLIYKDKNPGCCAGPALWQLSPPSTASHHKMPALTMRARSLPGRVFSLELAADPRSHEHCRGQIPAQIRKTVMSVLFIGTQFSNLYTAVDTPAEAA
jgi:hypothetical protein